MTSTQCLLCNPVSSSFKMWPVILAFLLGQAMTYPLQSWPVYSQTPKEYPDDDYYYAPKVQYYYDAPAIAVPDVYQMPYTYYYDPYGQFANEAPKRQEERLAALPIGQETWFESDTAPNWRSSNVDDVNAAFLDNLILTQMAQDAQRRRENARAAFPNVDYEDKDVEDEDVRELKALAGKPLYHVPKTVPRIDDDDDYAADDADSFINWNGNKRSAATAAPYTTDIPMMGQKEIMVPRPAPTAFPKNQIRKNNSFYNTIAHLLENHEKTKPRRIDKRFVAADSDLVEELRGLKHHIAT